MVIVTFISLTIIVTNLVDVFHFLLVMKISDPLTSRFEVPLEVPTPDEQAPNPLYDVTYTRNPFSLQITRISTNTAM